LLDRLLGDVLASGEHKGACFYLSTKENEAIAAKRFYLKNGFEVITRDELPDNFSFFYEDDLFMKRYTRRSSKCGQEKMNERPQCTVAYMRTASEFLTNPQFEMRWV